ncbi:hypothetical protein GCM10028819_02430 [Spirosoma humi]
MKIGERLLKHFNKKYEPSKMIAFRFGRYDVATKTDERGIIKGDRFARRLLKNANGVVIKDHRVGGPMGLQRNGIDNSRFA